MRLRANLIWIQIVLVCRFSLRKSEFDFYARFRPSRWIRQYILQTFQLGAKNQYPSINWSKDARGKQCRCQSTGIERSLPGRGWPRILLQDIRSERQGKEKLRMQDEEFVEVTLCTRKQTSKSPIKSGRLVFLGHKRKFLKKRKTATTDIKSNNDYKAERLPTKKLV